MKPKSATILLVEDDPDDAELVIKAFRGAGFQNPIHVVASGAEAIQYLKGEGPYMDRAKFALPRLVLLDIAMPGIDGWGVLTWLTQHREFPFMAVIVFTGSIAPGDEEKALRLGAAAYEVKPPTFQELVKIVDKIASFWLLPPLPEKTET